MKRSDKAIKVTSYVAGFFAISAAMLLVVFLALSTIGLIHPRKERITLHTDSISKTYDGTPLRGSAPVIRYGRLHPGHSMEIRYIPEYSEAGQYLNAPQFVILDASGADVTEQYDILYDFGDMTIEKRKITLVSHDKSKVYDGEPLVSDELRVTRGTLAQGHKLISDSSDTVTLPGVVEIQPSYEIVSANGENVTDQYAVTERFGDLQVLPIEIVLTTDSARKSHDGKTLSAKGWEHVKGMLLDGHTIDMNVTASIDDVGEILNEGQAIITDENGKDVSMLYSIDYRFGTLAIEAVPLYVTTKSAQKIYDGEPLSCKEWEITKGSLEEGATVEVLEYLVHEGIGSIDNTMRFRVTDKNGNDITYRYSLTCNYGTLYIQPRSITIRTGSANKVYDGRELSCSTFDIISGSLCENETVSIACTSIVDVGYAENYVLDCSIYRTMSDGSEKDVSACYRISFDYGTLKITAN